VQVRDFLHPEGGRKAPLHWWCKPPSLPVKQAPKPAPTPAKPKAKAGLAKTANNSKLQPGMPTKPVSPAADADATASVDHQVTADQLAVPAGNVRTAKQKQLAAKSKSVKKMAKARRQSKAEESHSLDVEPAQPMLMQVVDIAAPSTVLQPATEQPALPGPSKQTKPAASKRVSSQGLNGVSAFSARALSELMEDGPLLEALQDLLTALQAQETVTPADNSNTSSAATTSVPTAELTSLPTDGICPAEVQADAGARQQPAGPSGPLNDASFAADTDTEGQRKAEVGPSAALGGLGNAPDLVKVEGSRQAEPAVVALAGRPARQESKRLRGKAAALAKALGLGTAGVVKPRSKASRPAVQPEQSQGATHTMTLVCTTFSPAPLMHVGSIGHLGFAFLQSWLPAYGGLEQPVSDGCSCTLV